MPARLWTDRATVRGGRKTVAMMNTRTRQYWQRVTAVGLGMVMVISVILLARLGWVQGWQGWRWQAWAQRNRVIRVVQRAPRGLIFDRNQRPLAQNELVYTQQFVAADQVLERRIPTDRAMSLLATAPASIRQNYHRVYPYGPVLAHLIGYTQPPQYSTDVVTGVSGLEKIFNAQLAGTDGVTLFEQNAFGKATRLLQQQSAQPGQNLTLTVDAELAHVAWQALGAQRGSVIVSDPHTGEILAMVSSPSFWPIYPPKTSQTDGQSQDDDGTNLPETADNSHLLRDSIASQAARMAPNIVAALDWPDNPFLSRATAAVYPPGSVFKIVTALAGLEHQVVTSQTTVRDEGFLQVGDFTYANWYWRQYGRTEGEINLIRALARSNDIFFYKLAEWLGPTNLANFARLFSFGGTTGWQEGSEQVGLVPDPVWKQQYFGEKWFLGNTYHFGIGQGDLLVTPLQVQVMMSAVAEKGRKCQPRVRQDQPPVCQELSLQPESLAVVIPGLRQACSPGGTAYPFFSSPYDIMCKTGTAEFGAANAQGHRPTHGWFTAAVSKRPRQAPDTTDFSADIVITVMVESDETQPYKEGSRDAAPIAQQVITWWLANR